MSELARKLAAMKQKAAAPAEPAPAPPLVERTFTRPADPRLRAVTPQALRRMRLEGEADWEKCAFLDTETTGLSRGAGTVAFLVGVGRIRNGEFTVTQILMPDYPSEAELLNRVEALLDGADTVITFNGKNFDMPLLRARRVMCRLSPLREMREWDLLQPARRVWKLRLQSVRLARIEDVVLGLGREDDLPGSEVPGRYFEYLKTGYFPPLEDVIEHNRQDVLTMETLMCELGRVYGSPEDVAEQLDIFSLGREMERQKDGELASALYEKASAPPPRTSLAALEGQEYAREAALRLARLDVRCGRYIEARDRLETLCVKPGWEARTELSKLYEHRFRDYARALRYAELAREDAQKPAQAEDARRRVARLKQKTEG